MNEKIANLMRKGRESKGLTSSESASLLGCSQGTVSNVENGKFGRRESTLALIRKMIMLYGIKIDQDIKDYLNINNNPLNMINNLREEQPQYFMQGGEFIYHFGKYTETSINVSTNIRLPENAEYDSRQVTGFYVMEAEVIMESIKDLFEKYSGELDQNIEKKIKDKINQYFK